MNKSQIYECYNSIDSSIYVVISKCIFWRNVLIEKIILIKSTRLYQYCQINFSILCLRSFFFRVVNDDCFSIVIDKIFRVNWNNDTWRRTCRLSVFNFNDKIVVNVFLFFFRIHKELKHFLSFTYSTRDFLYFSKYKLNVKCKNDEMTFFLVSCIIFSFEKFSIDDDTRLMKNWYTIEIKIKITKTKIKTIFSISNFESLRKFSKYWRMIKNCEFCKIS